METDLNIKLLRERLGWNQQQMAEYLGLDRSSVSRIERGQNPKGPVRKLLQNLCNRDAPPTAPSPPAGVEAAE